MKKSIIFGVCAVFFFPGVLISLPARAAEGGEVKMSLKELYSLSNRKSYRLGLRGSVISPTDSINVNKDSTMDFGLEFDAKLNENFDNGPRFGIVSKKLKVGSTIDANYTAMKFGFGGRIYMLYWGEYGSTHGFFNLYAAGEADYYTVNKAADITNLATNPPSFAGMGVYGGIGVELAFGPNTSGFVEAGYQKTNIKSSSNDELPLDGYVVATGARLAFF
ncbi:hypothetical protein HZB08_00885 [Candidatus Saganbacteria bacterium]|uniref:Outer membrane protein beta-barrel domain-containing protein n=1 Tax=Candidatus Saganbacteria bacterium TaxID=2575572 RepID=A0A9D6UKM6_UNCSA|nr:hypothetical protein [Candidatus Saganbacteria bacterium]